MILAKSCCISKRSIDKIMINQANYSIYFYGFNGGEMFLSPLNPVKL